MLRGGTLLSRVVMRVRGSRGELVCCANCEINFKCTHCSSLQPLLTSAAIAHFAATWLILPSPYHAIARSISHPSSFEIKKERTTPLRLIPCLHPCLGVPMHRAPGGTRLQEP